MTVIAAMVHDGRVWMAADSQATDVNGIRWPGIPKVNRLAFDDGGFALVATAGVAQLRQMFAQGIITVTRGPQEGGEERWAYGIACAYTEACAESRPSLITEEGKAIVGDCLFAHRGRLWALDAHSAIAVERYAAIGSGAELALGALYFLYPQVRRGVLTAGEAVREAAAAAVAWSTTCGGEIVSDNT